MLRVGVKAAVALDEVFEDGGDGFAVEFDGPQGRQAERQLEGLKREVVAERERAIGGSGIDGAGFPADIPRRDVVGAEEFQAQGVGGVPAQSDGDDIVVGIVRLDAHEAVVATRAGVEREQLEFGTGGRLPGAADEFLGLVPQEARDVGEREEGEVESLPQVGVEREALDKMQEGELATEVVGIETGVEREAQGFVGGVRSKVNEARHMVMAGVAIERSER